MEEVGFGRVVAGYLVGKESRTRKRYRSDVSRWLSWCSSNLVDPERARREHLEAYMGWLRQVEGKSKRSVRSTMSAVHGLYRYAAETGYIPSDPGDGLRLPRVYGHSGGTFLDRREAAAFLAEARSRGGDVRALCALLLLNGLRVSEALNADVGDYDPRRALLTVASRKGDWCQVVNVSDEGDAAVRDLLRRRGTGPLLRCRGSRMKPRDARLAVADVASAVGAEGITPHSLRRSFCTLSRDAGVPDRDIMASGGWSSPQMLDYYDMARRGARSTAPAALERYLGA